jgi:hypothetical protein
LYVVPSAYFLLAGTFLRLAGILLFLLCGLRALLESFGRGRTLAAYLAHFLWGFAGSLLALDPFSFSVDICVEAGFLCHYFFLPPFFLGGLPFFVP